MATAEEKRIAVRDQYRRIIGRNYYSQTRRNYCYRPYGDGRYYSDCSSSICYAYREAGLGFGIMNTTGMWTSGKLRDVDVAIQKGVIVNPEALRIGDMLLFAGADPARKPWGYVGHVEMVGEMSGGKVQLYGHGSGRPRKHEMNAYCRYRYGVKTKRTPVGHTGLLRVRRYIPDDDGGAALRRGDRGDRVRDLQDKLLRWNACCLPGFGADGDYGAETQAAVAAFQAAAGLDADGVADERTLEALAAWAGRAVITGDAVNVRTGPGTEHDIIDIARRGQRLDLRGPERENGWLPVMFMERHGWVSGKYAKVE